MEIGVCLAPPATELATALRSAGCGYYEPPMAAAVMAADAGSFAATLGSWTVAGLPPRAANVLLPGELKVVGEHVDTDAVTSYQAEAGRRARLLGLEVMVFGSGTARNAPAGFPPETARRQYGEALRLHVCGPGRRPPAPGDEGYLAPLLRALAGIGYTRRCSIECRWTDPLTQAPAAVGTVRQAAEQAGLA